MKKTAWMVKDGNGEPCAVSLCSELHAWLQASIITQQSNDEMEVSGYRCVRVEITEVEGE